MSLIIRRELPIQARILDQGQGIVEYVASDETKDSYAEVIRASGWMFDQFAKNSPFVDSHDYSNIENLLGKVIDYRVEGKQLIETVQWAIDVPTNQKARIGWDMTRAGYLCAVSVGFRPVQMATKWDNDPTIYGQQMKELGNPEGVRAVYIRQQQIELSSCIIGANPNALLNMGKAFKAGAITDDDVLFISAELAKRTAFSTQLGHVEEQAEARARDEFLRKFNAVVSRL
jgi:hypothetical protein